MSPRQRSIVLKHSFDRVAAALLLVLLSPLLAGVAITILVLEGRPLLFRQVRAGLDGRPFTIIKFRTMRGDEGEASDDKRMTRLGQLLRETSLDELPELANVLRGEMSLVGPRPLPVRYLPRYTPEQMRRHCVRPGITGLAQVNGRNDVDWEKRFRFDLWYVENGGFWLDVKILARTIIAVLTRRGIHAPDHATMPEFMGTPQPVRPIRRDRPPRSQTRRLSYRIAAGAMALQLSTAACVAVIDPYDVVGIVHIDGINEEKTRRAEWGGRVERSLRLWLSEYDTLILGGSRARAALDPAGPVLGTMNAYNAAVPDASMVEVAAIGRFARRHDRPKRVIISLSLSMFEADRATAHDFESSGFDGDPMPLVYARTLLAPDATLDAFRTLRDNLRGLPAPDKPNGLHLRLHPDPEYREAFDNVLEHDYLVQPWHYAHFEYDPGRVELFRRLVADFARSGTDVYVYVDPVHARQLEAMTAMGVYPIFERWLTDLTGAVATVNADPASRGEVELWDFTGYDSITTETIPDAGNAQLRMTWYWNSSLYKPVLGERVLARMLGPDGEEAGLGARLDPSNVRAVLRQKRQDRAIYEAAHPKEVAEVARLVRQTGAVRAVLVRRFEAGDKF